MNARPSIRRPLGWALVIALCVAGATACVALLTGSFDDTDARVVGTSLGFAAFSSTAAAGAGARLHARKAGQAMGLATVIASGVAFLLLIPALWFDDGNEGLWRAWGCAGITALAGSHASLVLRGRRHEDTPAIDALVAASLLTSGLDWILGFLPLADIAATHVGEEYGRALGVITVVMLLTTGLQPLLRRLQVARPDSNLAARGFPHRDSASTLRQRLAAEVIESADRIEALADPMEVKRECSRLRELARSLAD